MERAQCNSQVWEPLLKKFNKQIDRSCLRRDSYLDRVFESEARCLESEIPEPNSKEARDYQESRVRSLKRQRVNFTLSQSTIRAIGRACESKNVVRDCFINRVLFLLTATGSTYEEILDVDMKHTLSEVHENHHREDLYSPLFGGSLDAISEIVDADPFRAIRSIITHLKEREKERDVTVDLLHARVILRGQLHQKMPEAFLLNCYLPDRFVPGTRAAKQDAEELASLLADLGLSEEPRAKVGGRKGRSK